MAIDVDACLRQLTQSEKISLLSGSDFWHLTPIPRLGIPKLRVSDGPHGVRGTKFFNGVPGVCLPSATCMGATFDKTLLHQVGKMLAHECKLKGVHVLLGPTINIQRSPLGGRGFESYSEDPLLAGQLAAAFTSGVQENKVGVCLKHFAAHDQTLNIHAVDAMMSIRTLREIHTMPFQHCLRQVSPWSIMTAYNRINGTHCSENRAMMDGILRDDWKWQGCIMTDWFGTYSVAESINAGCDLEMPGPPIWRTEQLVSHSLQARKIEPRVLDARVKAVLDLIRKCQASGIAEDQIETGDDREEDRAICRRVAAEGSVLLKNSASLLPLSRDIKTIALIGPNMKVAVVSGGGSAALQPYHTVSLYNGIAAVVSKDTSLVYHVGCYGHLNLPLLEDLKYPADIEQTGFAMTFRNADMKIVQTIRGTSTEILLHDNLPEGLLSGYTIEISASLDVEESGMYDFGVIVAGKAKLYIDDKVVVDNWSKQRTGTAFFGTATAEERGCAVLQAGVHHKLDLKYSHDLSGYDAPYTASSSLKSAIRFGAAKQINEQDAIAEAVQIAASADLAIVAVGTNGDWETEGHDRDTIDLPLRQNELVEAVLKSQTKTVVITQSGCPISMPWIDLADTVLHGWFNGQEGGDALASILFGITNPCGKLSLSFPRRTEDNPAFLNFGSGENSKVMYGEGVFVGYRHYERAAIAPLFPFGHGLSYSTFEYADLHVNGTLSEGSSIHGSVIVMNTSSIAGKEVVQVYVNPRSSRLACPVRELKWFTKIFLAAGASQRVEFELDKYSVSFWDDRGDSGEWLAEAGVFEVSVARSAATKDTIASTQFSLKTSFSWTGL